METRTVTEIRIYKLYLNNMQSPKIEMREVVAISTSYESLVNWCKSQEAKEVWTDTINGYNWRKSYEKDSYLEWYNKPYSLELASIKQIDGGITDEWISAELYEGLLNETNIPFVIIPEE